MSTRSNIIVRRADGIWANVYCHFDGYPAGVGQTLMDHYSNQEAAEKIVALGNLSVLGDSCECPKGHSFENQIESFTVAYGRDRGEEDNEAITGPTLASVWPDSGAWIEYAYIWFGKDIKEWMVVRNPTAYDGKSRATLNAMERVYDAIAKDEAEERRRKINKG